MWFRYAKESIDWDDFAKRMEADKSRQPAGEKFQSGDATNINNPLFMGPSKDIDMQEDVDKLSLHNFSK